MNAPSPCKLGLLSGWLFFLLLISPAPAQERLIVAVFDMEDRGSGLDSEALKSLRDQMVVRLTAFRFQVIPREQLLERLRAQKADSYRLCYDQTCQIELGRELAAQKSLSTLLLKIDDSCQLSAVLYDLKSATTDKAASVKSECTMKALMESASTVIDDLISGLVPEPAKQKPKPRKLLTFGLSGGVLFPSFGKFGYRINDMNYSNANLDVSGIGQLKAYYHFWRIAVGVRFGFLGGTGKPDGDPEGFDPAQTIPDDFGFNLITAEGGVMFVFDANYFDIRLGAFAGYHTIGGAMVTDYYNHIGGASSSDRKHTFGLSGFVEASIPIYKQWSLLIDFGLFGSPPPISEFRYMPILYLSTGIEFGIDE
jgi:hypothetical protein